MEKVGLVAMRLASIIRLTVAPVALKRAVALATTSHRRSPKITKRADKWISISPVVVG